MTGKAAVIIINDSQRYGGGEPAAVFFIKEEWTPRAHPTRPIQSFLSAPIPVACGKLIIPTVIGSLVAVLYSMADTYFVGALNDELQSAAVAELALAGAGLLMLRRIVRRVSEVDPA